MNTTVYIALLDLGEAFDSLTGGIVEKPTEKVYQFKSNKGN